MKKILSALIALLICICTISSNIVLANNEYTVNDTSDETEEENTVNGGATYYTVGQESEDLFNFTYDLAFEDV